jgi:hypothetical protein
MHEAKWSRAKAEQEAALFERPFRAPETAAPQGPRLWDRAAWLELRPANSHNSKNKFYRHSDITQGTFGTVMRHFQAGAN